MEYIKLSELKKLEGNPRTISKEDYKKLKDSVKKFGILEGRPFLVSNRTGENIIIGGNQRYEVCKELGIKEVPVHIDTYTQEQEDEIIIRDNVSNGDWDMEILANEWDAEQLNDWGLDVPLPEIIDEDKEAIEDNIPEEPKTIYVEKGDIFQLGEHRLMCGDSTSIDDVEKLMDGEKADITFTSPPYNANTKSSEGDIFKRKGSKKLYSDGYEDNLKSDDYIRFVKNVLENCFLITDGFIFWNVSYNNNSRFQYIKQIEDRLEFLIEQICWKKTSSIPFKGSLMRDWEPIYVFSTDGKKLGLDTVTSNFWEVNNTNSQQENHKACFPTGLPQKAMEILKDKKNIFEPFGGSGSTLIASEKTNRKCYMMELDEKYIQVIIKRFHDYTDGEKEIKCLNREFDINLITNISK